MELRRYTVFALGSARNFSTTGSTTAYIEVVIDRFVHLRTQAPPKYRQALLTAVLADGINLGLTRMSEACRETT